MIAVSGSAIVVDMKKTTLFATVVKLSPPSGSFNAIVELLNANADAAPVAKITTLAHPAFNRFAIFIIVFIITGYCELITPGVAQKSKGLSKLSMP